MAKILVVEDDLASRLFLTKFLAREGYEVVEAPDGAAALEHLGRVDLVLLDVMMPELDGWSVIEILRRDRPELPVIMLTALASVDDQVQGLDLGADDYITKPYDLRALGARVRALLRRSGIDGEIEAGGVRVAPAERSVWLDGRPLELTQVEFDLLLTLIQHPGRVFSRERLLERIWGSDYFGLDRVVDVRMVALRKKLGEDGRNPCFIETVRGVGYRFRPQEDAA